MVDGGGVTTGTGGLLSPAPSKVFLTVTRLYFSAEEGGERSVCLTFAFLFLLLAMLVQVVPEETLELGLEPGMCSLGPGVFAAVWGLGFKPLGYCCQCLRILRLIDEVFTSLKLLHLPGKSAIFFMMYGPILILIILPS